MADLPEIPDEAADAIAYRPDCYCDDCRPVRAAWPHLYAAALRHAAAELKTHHDVYEESGPGIEDAVDILRRLADEATPGAPA